MGAHGDSENTTARHKQVLSYPRLTGTRLGCLLNSVEVLMKNGVPRIMKGDVE